VPIAIGSLAALALAALGWFFFVRAKPGAGDAGPHVEAKEPAPSATEVPAASDSNTAPQSAPAEH
jgi:hypothetical protein